MKLLLICFLWLAAVTAHAQPGDFFILKTKPGKTIQRFYTGVYIDFITTQGESYSGFIKKVAADSVWVEYQREFRGFTAIGSVITDTIFYQARKFAVHDIAKIHKGDRGFSSVAAGKLLQILSGGYATLHLVNGLIQKQTINWKNIGIAAGVYLLGTLFNQLQRDYYYIGKKYRLQYIALSAPVS